MRCALSQPVAHARRRVVLLVIKADAARVIPPSGHSHHLVRAKVMSDGFPQISSPTDGTRLIESKRVNLLVV